MEKKVFSQTEKLLYSLGSPLRRVSPSNSRSILQVGIHSFEKADISLEKVDSYAQQFIDNDSILVMSIPSTFSKSECKINRYLPAWDWIEINKTTFRGCVLNSYENGGFELFCPGCTGFFELVCHGVKKIRLIFEIDNNPSNIHDATIYDEDLTVDRQYLKFRVPPNCLRINAVVLEKYDLFVSVFNTYVYCDTIRSSALSTPTLKLKKNPRPFDT